MASTTKLLTERGLIAPPSWLPDNVHYETIMGSLAYGVSSDASDEDVYGFCFPPKEITFPHLQGAITGFDRNVQTFEQYQHHHIPFSEQKMYDITIFHIVKYFRLCADGNPNMIDSLFTPARCVKHITATGQMVRERRHLFLSKKVWQTFKGYAYSQMNKIRTKTPSDDSKRKKLVEEFGYDVKFAYHIVRLMDEVEQILTTGDLDLERNREQLKAIRRGEWTLDQLSDWFSLKERDLERVYNESDVLPYQPREQEVKALLLECLESHYGHVTKALAAIAPHTSALRKIKDILDDVL